MIPADAFRNMPSLRGAHVRLEPLTEAVFEDYWAALSDAEVGRLTGTHAEFSAPGVREWLRTRREHHDRADWAVFRSRDGTFIGEAVLNDFDPANESASYRVWLAGLDVYGHGYGTEVTRLVVDYALGDIGLHRVSLEVFDHNPRARHVYETCGFVVEGRLRDALLWEGTRHDALTMAILKSDQ